MCNTYKVRYTSSVCLKVSRWWAVCGVFFREQRCRSRWLEKSGTNCPLSAGCSGATSPPSI